MYVEKYTNKGGGEGGKKGKKGRKKKKKKKSAIVCDACRSLISQRIVLFHCTVWPGPGTTTHWKFV